MGDTPTDDDTSRECSPQCTARRRLNSSHSLPCLLLAARNRSLRGGRVQPLICDSPVFPASPQPHSTSQPGYGDLIDEDDDDGFRTEVSEKSDRSSSIASTVRWDHSSQRASLLDFVATPYPISALFADKDHRCGNSRNGFYGLQDVLWFASWKHVGNTMSWYNLDESPLFIVPKRGWVRLHAVRFVDGAVFRCTILFAIVMNALSLAFDIPETKDNESIQNFLYVANFVFLVIFTAEAALKTLAMGFAQHKGAYLRSWWNVIDFALLISGYVALHPSVANVTVVRLVRLLRPLRTFSRVAGFRALLAALIGAMPHMANILLLVLFLLTIFALIGIQLWSGGLDNRCYVDLSLANESYSGPLSDDPNASRFAIIASERGCATDSWAYDGLDCNVDTTGVDLPQACRREAGAFHASVYNFDSFPNAVLLAFKVVSLDDWPTDMRQTQDAFGWWTWVYFILLVVLGNVVCVNLMLASMTLVLEQEKNQMRIEAAEAAEEEENKVLMCTWKDGESRKAEGDAGPEATRARTGKDSAANVSTDAVANLCPHSPVAEVPPLGLDAPLERQSSETWQALTNMANVTPVLDTAQRAYIDPKTGIKVRNISVATCHHTFARLAMSVYFSAFLTEPVRREKQTRVEPEHVLAVALAMRFAKSKKLSGSSAKGFGMHDLASRSCPNLMSPMQSMRIIAGRSKAGNMRSPTRSNIDFAATAVAATRPESSSNKRRPSSAIDRREKMGLAHANSMNRLTAEAVESTSELRRQDSNRARFPALAIQPDGDKVLPSDTASTGAVKSPSPCVAEPNTRFASQRSMRRGRAVQKSKVLAWPRRLSSSSTLQSKTSQAVPVPNTPLEPVSEAFAVALATNRTESPAPSGGELETLLTTVQLIRQKVRDVVLSEAVSRIILVITVLNVTLLCTDHHGISEVHESIIEQVSLYCNIIFVVELCVKVPAMGLSDYWRDSYNRTDAALVFVSIPEVIESRGSSVSAIRAFRLFRLARILRVGARLLPKFQSLRVIIAKAAISLKEASYIMLVMLLLVFIYSILGVQLFAAAFPPPVRTNFNSLWEAALTVFIVISGEYWATVMKIAIDSTSPVAALYFVSLFVLGNYILLNLFTSVIIFNFKDSVDDEEDDKHVSAAKAVELATKSALLRSKMAKAMFSSSDAECGKSVAPPSLNLQVATSRSRLLSPISHPLSPLDLDIKESVQTSSNQDPATPAQYDICSDGPTRLLSSPGLSRYPTSPLDLGTTSSFRVRVSPHTRQLARPQQSSVRGGEHFRSSPTALPSNDPMLPPPLVPIADDDSDDDLPPLVPCQKPFMENEEGFPERNRTISSADSQGARCVRDDVAVNIPEQQQPSRRSLDDRLSPSNSARSESFQAKPRVQPPSPHSLSSERASDESVSGAEPHTKRDQVFHSFPSFLSNRPSPFSPTRARDSASTCKSNPEFLETIYHDTSPPGRPRLTACIRDSVADLSAFSQGAPLSQGGMLSPGYNKGRSGSTLSHRARPDELCWPTGWAEDGQELRREKVELKEDNKSNTDTALHGTTLGIFSPDSLVRQMFAKVVLHRHFENGLSVLVSLNCIAIALSDPWWHRDRSRELALTVVDSVFTALFTLEMVAKMIVFGLWERYDPNASEAASENPSETGVGGPTGPPKFGEESVDEDANERSGYAMEIMELGDEHQPYLRCAWNRLDLFVVCLCIAGLFIKEFRIFRSLRAVRLVIRSENVKVVLLSLLHALPTMANVLVVLLFVFLVFAAVGIQIFKGALWQCNDPSIFHESDCTGLFNASERETWDGIPMTVETDRMWVNSRANFDHLGAALFTLFEVAIGEGWVTIMYRSIDSKTAGQGASRNARPFVSLFFVAFVTIGSFFAVNLFIGMLVDKFSEMQSYYSGHVFLTAAQAEWVQTVKVLHHAKLSIRSKAPKNRFRRKVYYLVESAYFDSAITLCIVLNVIVLASVHRGQSEQFTVAVEMINHGFLSVYVLEVFFKLFAWGWVDYIRDAVNRFDFALVVISLVGNIFLGSESTSLFRLCRLGRVFRLVSKAGGIRQVLFTLYFALPPLLNLSMLIVVVIYIYGAIGVELFGTVMLHEGLTEHHNFRSLPKASITLFTLCTGETWVDVMEACRVTTNCSGDECGTEWAVPYFVSFMLIGHLVGLNLVIMIIIEVLNHQQTQLTLLNNVENFKHRWLAYDPEAKERVTWRQLMFILRVLEAPLQFPEKAKETSAYLRNLRVPVSEDGLVRYVDVIFGLARIAMRVKDVEARSLNDKGYTNAPQLSGMVFSLHHVYYADIMQRWWRKTRVARIVRKVTVRNPRMSDTTSGSSQSLPGGKESIRLDNTPGADNAAPSLEDSDGSSDSADDEPHSKTNNEGSPAFNGNACRKDGV